MERFLGKYEPIIYALLRVVVGGMFALHGSQKLLHFPAAGPGGPAGPLPPMMLLAGAIELIGGLLIVLGLLAGFAAFLGSGQMAVAYFMAHAPRGLLPIANGGESAVLYCFVLLFIAARGSGALSLDAMLGRNRRPAT